ncbi:MAG: alpha/beta hydrolase [Candidatus Pacebacteria bacterium]|nr:alpha/beta hydrolase [Candidatus Paceibacterota bacterium]MDD5356766.1 alpha/beta hydrolase [Candidatus Paceibacterota bacterium]
MENIKIHIIHGWTYTLEAWEPCLAELRAKGFEPVMLRVPGLTEKSEKVWTLPEYVTWLEKVLQNESNVILLGHSNGGRIAIAAFAKNPTLIQKLILLDSAGVVHNEFPLRAKRAVFGSLAQVGKIFLDFPFVRKVFYKIIGAHDYGRAPENMRETMKNLISRDLTPELSKISIPTLIIWGKEDKITPLSDAYLMQKNIKDSKLVVVDGANHSPHATHPKIVAEEIAKFTN